MCPYDTEHYECSIIYDNRTTNSFIKSVQALGACTMYIVHHTQLYMWNTTHFVCAYDYIGRADVEIIRVSQIHVKLYTGKRYINYVQANRHVFDTKHLDLSPKMIQPTLNTVKKNSILLPC